MVEMLRTLLRGVEEGRFQILNVQTNQMRVDPVSMMTASGVSQFDIAQRGAATIEINMTVAAYQTATALADAKPEFLLDRVPDPRAPPPSARRARMTSVDPLDEVKAVQATGSCPNYRAGCECTIPEGGCALEYDRIASARARGWSADRDVQDWEARKRRKAQEKAAAEKAAAEATWRRSNAGCVFPACDCSIGQDGGCLQRGKVEKATPKATPAGASPARDVIFEDMKEK